MKMRMKGLAKKVVWFLSIVMIVTVLQLGFQVITQGMWLLGIPEKEQVQSVTISYPSVSDECEEVNDSKDIELCVNMTGLLKYDLFGKVDETDEPLITFNYHLADGNNIEVAASRNTVFYNGKKNVLKDDDTFVDIVEMLFFFVDESNK